MAASDVDRSWYLAEFLGTFILVFTIGCNVLSESGLWGGVSIACALTVMIYALAKSGGANFNPAVSLALGMTSNMKWEQVGYYMLVQLAGGLTGGFAYKLLFSRAFVLEPTSGHSFVQAGVAEAIYTFMLVFVVLNTACAAPENSRYYGIAIGFVIIAGAYGAGSISGGCFNPAVAFGIDVASAQIRFGTSVLYAVCEFAGAALAAWFYTLCRPPRHVEGSSTKYPLKSRLFSEFLGTYMLVLTVGLNVLSASPAGAFSIAACLMSMIFALGSCSGAHFNPAVTIGILTSKRGQMKYTDAVGYIALQCAGGIVAAFTYTFLKGGRTFGLKPETSKWEQVIIAEFVFTFVLVFVVLSVATTRQSEKFSQIFALAIGMCVTVGGCAIGKISGGSLNPAVSIGVSTLHILNGGYMWWSLVYSIVEILAGVCAAGAFLITYPSEYKQLRQ